MLEKHLLISRFLFETDQAARQGIPAPFRLIVPTPPDDPEYANPDGSIKYAALGSSGYLQWLSAHPGQLGGFWSDAGDFFTETIPNAAEDSWEWVDENIVEPGTGYSEDVFGYGAGLFDKAIDWTVNKLDDGWEKLQEGLQEFVLVFEDHVNVRLTVQIENRDPMFPKGSLMRRAWGPNDATGNRPTIVPTGAAMRLRQWGWGFLPVMDEAKINQDGFAKLEAIKGADGRGGDLCIELDADYAMMTSDFIPDEICDFAEDRYGDYETDINDLLVISQKELHAFTQLKDSSDYVRTVIGHDPRKMDVLFGDWANDVTEMIAGKRRAQCLCLDFPSVGAGALTTALVALYGVDGGKVGGPYGAAIGAIVGAFVASMYQKDLWWPDDPTRNDSRGVMTHEYGHLAMCSMLYEEDGPGGLTGLIARIFEGQDDSRDDEVALMTEGWADLFLMQVVGAANYVNHDGSTNIPPGGGTVATGYCFRSPCMDSNYGGNGEYSKRSDLIFEDELARYQSMMFDFFDRSDSNNRLTNSPWNGDVWARTGGPLQFSPTGYIANDDEPVALPGSSWRKWIKYWLERGKTPNIDNVIGGLVDTARNEGATWCDVCEAIAPHFPSVSGVTQPRWDSARMFSASGVRTNDIRFDRWTACANDSSIRKRVGAPPEPDLNLDANCVPCSGRQRFDRSSGQCAPCGVNEIGKGDHCEACPVGAVALNNNTCSVCQPNDIVSNGQCFACSDGYAANRSANVCELCAADGFVDWRGENLTCLPTGLAIDADAAPQDNCPNEFWVGVTGLDDIVVRGADRVLFQASSLSNWQVATRAECRGEQVKIEYWEADDLGTWRVLDSSTQVPVWTESGCPGFLCSARCEHVAGISIDPGAVPSSGAARIRVTSDSGAVGRLELQVYNFDLCSVD